MESAPQAHTFQRARRPEQREARRQAILDAAHALLREMPAAEVSLREIGRRIGGSKSSVVRYFETREAVFLELLHRARQEWLDELEVRLPAPVARDGSPPQPHEVTDTWAASIAERPMLCELWSMLPAVLERNVSPACVRSFKLGNREQLRHLAGMLHRRLPGLARADAQELVDSSVVVIVGLWPFANPGPAVREAVDDPRLAASRIDFTRSLSRTLQLLIAGLLHPPTADAIGTTTGQRP